MEKRDKSTLINILTSWLTKMTQPSQTSEAELKQLLKTSMDNIYKQKDH